MKQAPKRYKTLKNKCCKNHKSLPFVKFNIMIKRVYVIKKKYKIDMIKKSLSTYFFFIMKRKPIIPIIILVFREPGKNTTPML